MLEPVGRGDRAVGRTVDSDARVPALHWESSQQAAPIPAAGSADRAYHSFMSQAGGWMTGASCGRGGLTSRSVI